MANLREIEAAQITETIKKLCIGANVFLSSAVVDCYKKNLNQEISRTGQQIISQLIANADCAQRKEIPLCQDTGIVVVFMDIGQDVHIIHGDVEEAVHTGIARGYEEGYLRNSTADPITRKGYAENAPGILHTRIVPGNSIHIYVLPKGFGAEMMSRVTFFPASDTIDTIMDYVLELVTSAGGKPCPPIVLGIGIGGTLEKAALLAKRSLIRPLGQRNIDHSIAQYEELLLGKINNLGIGPMGLGGKITALDVHIETYPTHIAGTAVAVNFQCHSYRHQESVL